MPPLLIQQVEEFCRENFNFQPDDKIIVAISGGIDSTALLHLLHESRFQLRLIAVYVDHGLRPHETDAEIEFVQQCAEHLAIPFIARRVNVAALQKERKCSPEEAARIARYNELELLRQQYTADYIAVAHTADDQAEEILIRLIRGTGLKGLSGMTPVNGHIIRPLLARTKSSLAAYLKEKNFGFCHDSSNDERTFLRNKVRLDLLPLLEKDFNPSIRNTLLQTAEILQQDEALLAQISDEHFQQLAVLNRDGADNLQHLDLSLSRSRAEHPAILRRILELSCWKIGNRPTFRTIAQLQALIDKGVNGSQLHLSHGLRVHLVDDAIRFFYPSGKKSYRGNGMSTPATFEHTFDGPSCLHLPELGLEISLEILDRQNCNLSQPATLFADADELTFPLTLRSAHPGERFRPLGSPGKKKVTRILSDMKIRAEKRANYPVLTCGDHLIAIVGAKLSDEYKLTPATQKVLAISYHTKP